MNATDLIQSYFDADAVARLAQAVGLEPDMAGRVLEAGLPLQLRALAGSANTPEGEAMIANAVDSLPRFGSVAGALEQSGGAANLQQAGELLASALLGGAAETLPAQVAAQMTEQAAADPARVQTLLQMALPLLLSALGQRGLKAGNIAPMLAGLAGAVGVDVAATEAAETVPPASVEPVGEVPAETAPVALEKTAPEASPSQAVSAEAPAASAKPAPSEATPPDPSTPDGLLKYLQARFGGPVGQQLGAVAGFGGGVRKQAALAALPVVLAALVGKAGAGGNLDTLARPFAPLTGDDGQVNTDLLDSPVEVARIEGQGRGLLASLFGDVNAVTGRLGSALGGSGDSSRRLLALLTPLVLSALSRAHPNGLAALPIGGLADGLKAALPPGFSSLGVLIGSLAAGTPLPGAASTTVQTTPRVVVQQGAPVSAAPPRPSPLKPARPARFQTPAPPPPPPARRRGGFPLWLIPLLLLLLLGGCWVLQNRQPATPAPAPTPAPSPETTTAPITPVQAGFTDPQGGAAVPAGGFTLRGTGPAGETLSVFQGDDEVGSATVGPDGTWSLDVGDGAPQGPQTYTLRDTSGGDMATLDVVVGGAGTGSDGMGSDGMGSDGTGSDGTVPDGTVPDGTGSDSTGPDSTGAAPPVSSTPAVPSVPATPDADAAATAPDSSPSESGTAEATVPGGVPAADSVPAPAPATPAAGTPATDGTATDNGAATDDGAASGAATPDVPAPSSAPTPAPTPINPKPINPAPSAPTSAPAPAEGSGTPALAGPAVSGANDAGAAAPGIAAAGVSAAGVSAADAATVPVVITEPADGARVAAGGLTLRGTGPAGEQFELFHSGLRAGSMTVGADGTWKAVILAGAALPGPQRYDLRNAAGQVVARIRLQVAPSTQGAAGRAAGNAGTAASAGAARVTVGSPASGAQVPGTDFALSGSGPAGQTFEVLEDGVSIGSFTVGTDGTWTRQVPGPGAGAKTYVIRSADGQQVASLPVTVEAAPAGDQDAACTQALDVSLADGETVTAPYRFGGVGGGSAYTVTVKRGERIVGTKTVPVGAGCGWSYTSNPGSSAGPVTYEVRPADASPSDAPAARLTLNVR
ncbi:DUF937 domain-containing protein [Deinococcus frigens]|uniref:DUF937 domain-containing protein n=2 Tax=Deinococcus frigens TaxID=249403 RepID=UPI00138E4313|nr:DUF937 domain-containing protein [Deinococcus frigens]